MKNSLSFYITIINVFSFICFAQKTNLISLNTKMEFTQVNSPTQFKATPKPVKVLKSYYVEEKINMKFGGHTTTYEVSKKNMISTYDLGPNNSRVITEKFKVQKQLADYSLRLKIKPLKIELNPYNWDLTDRSDKPIEIPKPIGILKPIEIAKPFPIEQIKVAESIKPVELPYKSLDYIYVYAIKTYKVVADKGYKSIDIFKKIGNDYFFNNEMISAAKWYGELFAMTTDLGPEYYYRYGHALKAIGENSKASEMLNKYDLLSGSSK